jgi:hypothetical protein
VRQAIFSFFVLALLGSGTSSSAQETPSRLAVDVSAGYAGFADETLIGHVALGGGVRWQLTPKISVGPDFVFMRGPDDDRDIFLTGKVIVDFMPDRLVSPFVVADGGAMFHGDRFVTGAFWAREGAVSGGGGVRINLTPRVSISPEFRIGWEPHLRVGATVSWRP